MRSNTLHRYYQIDCPHCGLKNQSLPERAALDQLGWPGVGLTQWRLIGPSLAVLIVYLSMEMRLTCRQIKRFLSDFLGLELSVGSIQNCKIEAARALALVEERLVEYRRNKRPIRGYSNLSIRSTAIPIAAEAATDAVGALTR